MNYKWNDDTLFHMEDSDIINLHNTQIYDIRSTPRVMKPWPKDSKDIAVGSYWVKREFFPVVVLWLNEPMIKRGSYFNEKIFFYLELETTPIIP